MNTADSPGWKWNGKRDVYVGLPEEIWKQPIPVTTAPKWLLDPVNQKRISEHLTRYLTSYSGRYFEAFASRSTTPIFSTWDVLAAESLSIVIPPEVVVWLTDSTSEGQRDRDDSLNRLHRRLVLGKETLWTCDEALLSDEEDLNVVYQLLKKRKNMGYVKSSKLLAAKFPAIVPIRDRQVEALLDLRESNQWWRDIRGILCEGGAKLVGHLDGLPVPEGMHAITTLRRLDIILWMEAKAREISPRGKNKEI